MKNNYIGKIIFRLTILILIITNLCGLYLRVTFVNKQLGQEIKECLGMPNDSKVILAIMEGYYVSRPWIKIISITPTGLNVQGGRVQQSEIYYKLNISEILDGDIFKDKNIRIFNYCMLLIIIFTLLYNKHCKNKTSNK